MNWTFNDPDKYNCSLTLTVNLLYFSVCVQQKHDQGQILLDAVFKHLELTERDYFGLHLADDSSDNPVSLKVKRKDVLQPSWAALWGSRWFRL